MQAEGNVVNEMGTGYECTKATEKRFTHSSEVMSQAKSLRRSSASNRSVASSTATTTRKTSIFPLPNATKPRYTVPKKIELNELPDDVLLEIFRFLSPIDLLNIGVVCRRWHSVSQDESLWRSLSFAYGLHQQASTMSSKQRVQTYLNNLIKSKLKSLFPGKRDASTSYNGLGDYQNKLQKQSNQIQFLLAFCDDQRRVMWSQKGDTIKYFEASMTIRWFDLTMPELLSRVHHLRLFAVVSVDMNTRPNRTRLPKPNEQLADVTQKPGQHVQNIQSLLHEYAFNWSRIRNDATALTNDSKSPIRVSAVPDEDDYLLATYDKDKSYAFLLFNINYLSFHERFFAGLRVTTVSNQTSLSQSVVARHLPTINDLEVVVFLCIRNMTTVFLRHRFPHCRLRYGSSLTIELLRITDMAEELGPELEQLPKFNWKTGVFNGTISDLCLIDLVVVNEHNHVSFSVTLPAKLLAGGGDQPGQSGDYMLSSNVWTIQAVSQRNKRFSVNGTIMRLDSEYCALGRDSQSWHLQQMTCQF